MQLLLLFVVLVIATPLIVYASPVIIYLVPLVLIGLVISIVADLFRHRFRPVSH